MRTIFKAFFIILCFITASAAVAQTLPADKLVLFPAKQETTVLPGESQAVVFNLANNLSQAVSIKVSVEDFALGDDKISVALNDEPNPYSLKPYLVPSQNQFTLAPGATKSITATINLPVEVPPGSRYAAVIFEQVPDASDQSTVANRLGGLLLVKVDGEVEEGGKLTSFNYSAVGNNFVISFANSGNVYLNPYGFIEVKSFLGGINEIGVDPWFVLPGDERIREVNWPESRVGVYRATLVMNRGYDNIIDRSTIWVWQVPWYLTTAFIVVLFALGLLVIKWRRK